MHEMPVIKEIMKTVKRYARKKSIRKVSKINLVVGELSSIVDDSMEYYFQILSKSTVAENAVLSIKRTQAIAVCSVCNSKIPTSLPLPDSCCKCQSKNIKIDGGLEFFIDSIEVEDEN
jgi:hydrogenase nickel incorporation protein HypA/HybF